MLIRSQDKRAITDDMKLYVRENDFVRGKVTWEIRNAEQDLLATYSTEKKAIKVLDMIQKAYCAMRRVDCLNTGTVSELAQIGKESREEIVNELGKMYVFQMPSDEEVPND